MLTEGFSTPDTVKHYHNNGNGRRTRNVPLEKRRIIAWDGEGMNLSGENRPQHYVVFGCSVEADSPMVSRDLISGEILEYICDVGERFPSSVHIGYGFRYDANMIIRHLPVRCLVEIKEKGETYYDWAGSRFRIHWLPGKRLTITRNRDDKKVTVQIDDIISFFASSFIVATESILGDELTEEDREVIAHGKAERGNNTWDDLPDVLHYWQAEIRLMERLMAKFRDVMFANGFMLRNWYGPGALSSYLIRTHKLRPHIVNGPPELPRGVHQASKHAYAGGRFELFSMGRFNGPIYSLDINSAYPYAMSQAPALGENDGFWQHVEAPTEIARFGVYRIRFHIPDAGPFEPRPQPLFHRDFKGSITFPNVAHGWYWSPEAASVAGTEGTEICEGYEWVPADASFRPFAFLAEMYAERARIGKKNVMSMPYKLGPNSMYGKFAQRVGFTTDLKGVHHPPRSHCLPLAGWVTSYTRAMLFNVVRQIPWDEVIAVETDGIYTTADPSRFANLTMGDGLGEWDATYYDEMLYLQSGVYHRRIGNDWLIPKSRGLDVASVSLPVVREYLRNCQSGDFPALTVSMRPRFVGLTAAAAGSAPLKVRHCRWESGTRELEPGGKGKRVHIPAFCGACRQGMSGYDGGHTLVVRSRSNGSMSAPHWLPWEAGQQYEELEEAEALDALSQDMSI